jgi:hypothetical protein
MVRGVNAKAGRAASVGSSEAVIGKRASGINARTMEAYAIRVPERLLPQFHRTAVVEAVLVILDDG